MEFVRTMLPGVLIVRPRVYEDSRGYFLESWEQRKFAAAGIDLHFVQDNLSRSVRGVLRGLHYQVRQPQGKLVQVVRGSVFDVVVDIRRSSATFGRWLALELSEQNHHVLWIPPGFAHGFLVLSEVADFLYRVTDFYAPAHERTILWNDPDLAIDWPLSEVAEPILSAKDAAGARFRDAECYL